MNNYLGKMTLLSQEELEKDNILKNKLRILSIYGNYARPTDLALLTGRGIPAENANFWTLSQRKGLVCCYGKDGILSELSCSRNISIRPVFIPNNDLFYEILLRKDGIKKERGLVTYGTYPQHSLDFRIQLLLEEKYQKGELRLTGNKYTFDKTNLKEYFNPFNPITYDEYEIYNNRYIRYNVELTKGEIVLSNGISYKNGDYVWLEVTPIVWLIDFKTKKLISDRCLLSGIRFDNPAKEYYGDFQNTEMNEYLNKYMFPEIIQNRNWKYENNFVLSRRR